MRYLYLPAILIVIIFISGIVGYSINPEHRSFEMDSSTKLVIMHGDAIEKIISVPDSVGDSRFVFIMGKTKAMIYDTTAETAGGYPKQMVMSDMGEKCLGKEHLRIMREHFKGEL